MERTKRRGETGVPHKGKRFHIRGNGSEDSSAADKAGEGLASRDDVVRRLCREIQHNGANQGAPGVLVEDARSCQGSVTLIKPNRQTVVNPGGVDRGPVGPVSSQAEVIRARDAVDIAGCSSTWQPLKDMFDTRREAVVGHILPLTLSYQPGSFQHFIDTVLLKVVQSLPFILDPHVDSHLLQPECSTAAVASSTLQIDSTTTVLLDGRASPEP